MDGILVVQEEVVLFFPFITGTMALNLGIVSLQPLCVFLLALSSFRNSTHIFFFSQTRNFSDDGYFMSCLGLCTQETQDDTNRFLKKALFYQ